MNYTSGHGIFFPLLSFFLFLHCDPGIEAVTIAKYFIMQLFFLLLGRSGRNLGGF